MNEWTVLECLHTLLPLSDDDRTAARELNPGGVLHLSGVETAVPGHDAGTRVVRGGIPGNKGKCVQQLLLVSYKIHVPYADGVKTGLKPPSEKRRQEDQRQREADPFMKARVCFHLDFFLSHEWDTRERPDPGLRKKEGGARSAAFSVC